MSAAQPTPYRVQAYNISHASENKIHDDTVAQRLGFAGGLVPGVEVYAYACHAAVQRWGRTWLEHGQMQCRFFKPVYDGHIATVTSTENDKGLDITVDSQGVQCATAHASPASTGSAPSLADYQLRVPPRERPPADERSLAEGTWLGIAPVKLTADAAAQYLRDVRETDPLYAEEKLAHPGFLLRLCNLALRENVVLQPWIHTGSKVRNFSVARIGDELTARARVAANYERKGHRLVDLDVLLIANGTTPIAHVMHTAVYRLRQLAAE
jgi:acyl dehydratase